jgi:hypothetical protein
MTKFEWKILETFIEGNVLIKVKYRCKAVDDQNTVETEGNWTFRAKFAVDENTSESQVAHWLDLDAIQDDKHLIKYRLQEQLDALKSAPTTKPPWAVDTFKVTI